MSEFERTGVVTWLYPPIRRRRRSLLTAFWLLDTILASITNALRRIR